MNYILDILTNFNSISVAFRILLATIVGGTIGMERGKHGRAAGLRTHILICLGAAMTSMISLFINKDLGYTGDISRISAQVISGIGFLGAGTILIKNNSIVTGLTTAAGMWATAAIGIAIGYGFYEGTILCTLVFIFTTAFLTKFETNQKALTRAYIELDYASKANSVINSVKSKFNNFCCVNIVPARSRISGHLGMLVTFNKDDNQEMIDMLLEIDGILFVVEE